MRLSLHEARLTEQDLAIRGARYHAKVLKQAQTAQSSPCQLDYNCGCRNVQRDSSTTSIAIDASAQIPRIDSITNAFK